MLEASFASLILLLVGSNVLWGLFCNKLINKMMSRTYWEYQQAKGIPKAQEQTLADALKDVKISDDKYPNELDSLDEMIRKVLPLG